MTFDEIMIMIHNACCKVFINGAKGHEETVIQCATQIYVAQMNENKECKNPQEYKKGHWIDGESECPVCGEDKFKNLDADIWADWKPPFCPNCGAPMEE